MVVRKKMLSDRSKLCIQLTLSIVLFLSELVVGYLVNSIALIADAFHLLSDITSLVVAVHAMRLASNEAPSSKYSYGMQRAETLGALINGVMLIGLCFTILFEAIPRFFLPVEIDNPYLILIVGTISLCFNIFGMFLFGETRAGKHKYLKGSLNMHGVYLRMVGDTLSSLAVIGGALVILLCDFPERHYFDPIISLLIALLLIRMTLPLIRHASTIFMQSVPADISIPRLTESILRIDGVIDVHELHIWQLTDIKSIASVHVVIPQLKFNDFPTIAANIKSVFHSHDVHSVTIQPERHYSDRPLGACLLKCEKTCAEALCCKDMIKPY